MFSKALALVSFTIVGGTVLAAGCSSSSSGSGTGDDTTPDAEVADVRPDTHTSSPDAETFDTGPSGDDSSTAVCAVQQLPDGGTFPPIAAQAAMTPCEAGDITAFVNDCFGSQATATTCDPWVMGSGVGSPEQQECGACLNGNSTTMQEGVLVPVGAGEGSLDEVSGFGCVYAVDTSSAGVACANALWDLYVCENTACQSCTYDPQTMTGTDDDTGTKLEACNMTAEGGVCATYVTGVNTSCASELAADGGAAVCDQTQYMGDGSPDSAFFQALFTIGHAMCGGS
jgi:hypothetical protein